MADKLEAGQQEASGLPEPGSSKEMKSTGREVDLYIHRGGEMGACEVDMVDQVTFAGKE